MGSKDWQTDAHSRVYAVATPDQKLHLANPRWTGVPLADKLPRGEQRSWEKYHYRAAMAAGRQGVKGVVLFWVAADEQAVDVPNRPGRAHGQGTRSEFSEVIGARQFAPHDVGLVLGIDPEHSGRGLSEYRHTAEEFGIPIHESLGATVTAALDIIYPRGPA
jgi:hypothetical protein